MSREESRDRGAGFRDRLVWAVQAFLILFAVWAMLNGAEGWVTGLIAAALGGAVTAWLAQGPPNRWNPFRLAAFTGFFLLESVRAGFDVAFRTLDPWMPVEPGFFDYPIRLPEGQPRTLLISIITLLPGTLSAELSGDGAHLVIHELTPGGRDAVLHLEDWIAWLFSLPEWPEYSPQGGSS
jgi:multicomponent Na+:H+ antiporter subunit E